MFARFVTLLPLATLAAVAAAAPNVLEARTPSEPTCNSGSVNCCNSAFDQTQYFSGILGGLLSGLDLNLLLQCDPITVIGVLSDGTSCTQQTACCENVYQNGLVNVACTPVAA